jgi:hypothetical protein
MLLPGNRDCELDPLRTDRLAREMAIARYSSARAIAERWRLLWRADKSTPSAHYFQDTSENGKSSIARITSLGVECGEISPLFHEVAAVILDGDDRVNGLLESTLDWLGLADESAGDGQLSFGSNLFDLARNHQGGNMRVGDMLRFVPKVFGHLARKFVVYQGAGDNSLQACPGAFYSSNRWVPVPHDILESAWNLMSEVLVRTLPARAGSLAYAVEVDVLVYPTSSFDVRRLHTLLTDGTLLADSADSAGFWSQLGHRIDASRERAAGVFKRKGIRDLFAIASLIPGFRGLMATLNERMSVAGNGSTPKDFQVIGAPHFDSSRYITGLIGRRDNVDTQILWEDRWISLPVTADALAIFPSSKISSISNIPATRHRVLVHDLPGDGSTASRNITLSLAIVGPPANSAQTARLARSRVLRGV